MKNIIVLILIFITAMVFGQRDVMVLYVDASSSEDKYDKIQDRFNNLVNENPNKDILLYISNGDNPIVANNRGDVAKSLRKMRSFLLQSPNPLYDVKRINSLLRKEGYVYNISQITKNDGVDQDISFHFYFDLRDYTNLQLKDKIIKPLLFTNRLMFTENENGLHETCDVFLHLGTQEDTKSKKEYIPVLESQPITF